ncbi:uncharacterized protein [Amphiura filiformis]|uniref:uncharacterized protein n=1 Tax=Amphiura filiformis TaxID=82378 RepID=UPI003B220742
MFAGNLEEVHLVQEVAKKSESGEKTTQKKRDALQQKQHEEIVLEDDKDTIKWLKHNNGTANVVLEKMRRTAYRSQQWIKGDGPGPSEIVDKYPRILDPGVDKHNLQVLKGTKNNHCD